MFSRATWLLLLWMLSVPAFAQAKKPCNKNHPCTPTPTRTPVAPTKTPTPAPPTPTRTPIPPTPTWTPVPPTATPTPIRPTPTPTLVVFAPLQRSDATCPIGQTNFYGTCVNFLKVFGHDRLGQWTRNQMALNKSGLQCGVAIDQSVKPNRVAVAACDYSAIFGYTHWGTCTDGSPCTWPSDCPATDACVGNPARDADVKWPRLDIKDGACNDDDNVGVLGPSGRDRVCLMNYPLNSNMPESYYSSPLTFDDKGNLYTCEKFAGRCVEWFVPFETDDLLDDVWGQDDFTSNKTNKGLPRGQASDSSLWPIAQPDRAYRGSSTITPDGAGGVWIADQGNSRVVHSPAGPPLSHRWDICLGHASCTDGTTAWPQCYQGGGGKGTITDLGVTCNPIRAAVHPTSGELYVLDAGRDGWGGNYGGRILVYKPPFHTGQAADRFIVPQITQLTDDNGVVTPYSFRGTDFRFDESGQSLLWVIDDGANGKMIRGLLLDANGNVLSTVGSTAPDRVVGNYGSCGDPMQNYYWMGSNAIDVTKEGLWGTGWALFARYLLPLSNWTASDGKICPPRSAGGLYDNTTWWGKSSPDTFDTVGRVAVKGTQLIASDFGWAKTKVWNDYQNKPWGVAPDFEIVMGDHDDFQQVAFDDEARLWFVSGQGTYAGNEGLHAMRLPLTATSKPIVADAHLYWADDPTGAPLTDPGGKLFGTRTPNQHIVYDKPRDRLLIMWPPAGVILGVSNYRAVDSGGKLLVDWVWGAPDKAHLDSCNQGGAPTARTLCSGGQMALSPVGDVWFNDMAGSNWDTSCGNNRVGRLSKANLDATGNTAPGTVTFAQFDFDSIIRPGGASYTSPGLCGVYQASTIAMDTHGRLWMTGHGGMPYAPTPYSFWEMVVYGNPVAKPSPDYYVRIPLGYTPSVTFNPDNGDVTFMHQGGVYVINPDLDPSWLTALP